MSALIDHRASPDDDRIGDVDGDSAQPAADGAGEASGPIAVDGPDLRKHPKSGRGSAAAARRADDDAPAPGADEVAPAPEAADGDDADAADAPAAASGAPEIDQDPGAAATALRADFGAHFEANYQRLVAQLFAITLDSGRAHDAVQDAYSRAWRQWRSVGAAPDPTAWIRSVAVRSTTRSWRNLLMRVGIGRPRPVGRGVEPRTAALLAALRTLPAPERRAVVLTFMSGISLEEIAAIDRAPVGAVQARLSLGRRLLAANLPEQLPVPPDAIPEQRGADEFVDLAGYSGALYGGDSDRNGEGGPRW